MIVAAAFRHKQVASTPAGLKSQRSRSATGSARAPPASCAAAPWSDPLRSATQELGVKRALSQALKTVASDRGPTLCFRINLIGPGNRRPRTKARRVIAHARTCGVGVLDCRVACGRPRGLRAAFGVLSRLAGYMERLHSDAAPAAAAVQ